MAVEPSNPKASSEEETLTAIRGRLERATPTEGPDARMTRYDHGGGRLFIDGEKRNLIADFYEEADREFYYHARADIPFLLRLLVQLQGALLEANMNYAGRDLEAASYLARAEAAERERDEARAERDEWKAVLHGPNAAFTAAWAKQFLADTTRALIERANIAESRLRQVEELIKAEIDQQTIYARGTVPCADVWKDRPGPSGHAHTAAVLRTMLQVFNLEGALRLRTDETKDDQARSAGPDVLPAPQHAPTETKG